MRSFDCISIVMPQGGIVHDFKDDEGVDAA